MSQIERIDDYIKEFGSITGMEAMSDLGIAKYSARFTEMTQSGYPLKSKWERGKNRWGEPTRYKRYYYDETKLPNGKD